MSMVVSVTIPVRSTVSIAGLGTFVNVPDRSPDKRFRNPFVRSPYVGWPVTGSKSALPPKLMSVLVRVNGGRPPGGSGSPNTKPFRSIEISNVVGAAGAAVTVVVAKA